MHSLTRLAKTNIDDDDEVEVEVEVEGSRGF